MLIRGLKHGGIHVVYNDRDFRVDVLSTGNITVHEKGVMFVDIFPTIAQAFDYIMED